ncbi:MAG: primase, DNA primase protein [Armatimonadetes bacterium CSP1-3]|nr:MAG: primase, DNA primase protein [Armatimonadetes bacterium CSP1-3]
MRERLGAARDEIRQRINLVELVSQHVALKKAGRQYKGLCPFHQEKTPSFHVDRERGLWYCFGCFPPGQLVKTPFGYHPIETLTDEHPIVSGQGNYQRVLATHARDYNGDLIEIVTRKIRRPVRLTADHEVFIVRPTARHETRFKYFARRFRAYLRRYEDDPGYYFRKIAKWLPIRKMEATELRVGDLLLYPINDRVSRVEQIDLEDYVSARGTRGKRPARLPVVPVSEDFLRLIGYFIAEGSTHRAYVRFSLGNHEEVFASEIIRLIKSLLGIRSGVHRRRSPSSGLEITACHAALANAFANLCGRGAEEKHIPFVFQELPPSQKRILVEAIARGDGTQSVANQSSHTRRSITTVSPVLAEQVVDFLLALGRFPSVQLREPRRDRQGVVHREAYTIQWSEDARARYDLVYRTDNGRRYWLLPIERLGKLRYRGPVYNLTVEKDHSYIVSHIAVANCGQGGDAFDFVMRTGNLSFPEALEQLAARTGVRLERSPEEGQDRSEREQMLRALDAAAAFYREQLAGDAGQVARAYLEQRGVDAQTRERFGLGAAPQAWDALLRHLRGRGYPVALLERAGLVQARSGGEGHFDFLRHRLIFPIQDLQDRTVAFGGRALDDATPKYLNSRESPAFNKGRMLYALNWAREAIREAGEVVIVEGYMDVVTCHQVGIRHAVASLGTALTPDHVLLLKRFAPRAVVVYDPDAAGMAASERGLHLFEEAELPVRVAALPQGRDPDSFLRQEGPEKFRTILATALSMFDYQVAQALSRHDPRTLEGKIAFVDELLPVLGSVANPVRQSEYLRALAERFKVSEDALRQRLVALRRSGRGAAKPPEPSAVQGTKRFRAERLLVHMMVQAPEARKVVRRDLSVEDFLDPLHRNLAQVLLDADAPAEALKDRLADQESVALLTRLLFEPLGVAEKDEEKVLLGNITTLRRVEVEERLRELRRRLAEAEAVGNEEEVANLQRAIWALRSQEPRPQEAPR